MNFDIWLRDFAEIALKTQPPDQLIGFDGWLDRVLGNFRKHYHPLIPEMVNSFPGGIQALRQNIFDRVRRECTAKRDVHRGRKIILHPLLVASIDDNTRPPFKPTTFTNASDKNHAIILEGKNQWVFGFEVINSPHGFATCPEPGCIIGSYTYPDNIIKHV